MNAAMYLTFASAHHPHIYLQAPLVTVTVLRAQPTGKTSQNESFFAMLCQGHNRSYACSCMIHNVYIRAPAHSVHLQIAVGILIGVCVHLNT